jgi:hypothetical protein
MTPRPGRWFARWYVVDSDGEDGGPDEEVTEEICNYEEIIDEAEALRRAASLNDRHPDAYAYDVVERTKLVYDYGWEWIDRLVHP